MNTYNKIPSAKFEQFKTVTSIMTRNKEAEKIRKK